jgi:hypothetical protein
MVPQSRHGPPKEPLRAALQLLHTRSGGRIIVHRTRWFRTYWKAQSSRMLLNSRGVDMRLRYRCYRLPQKPREDRVVEAADYVQYIRSNILREIRSSDLTSEIYTLL